MVNILLDTGAFVNAADNEGQTPLVLARKARQSFIDFSFYPRREQEEVNIYLRKVQEYEQIIDVLWRAGGREIGFQGVPHGARHVLSEERRLR